VHVRVDEAWHDRGAGKLDDTIGARRFAHADPLDVTAVDEHPLPHRGIRERMDARGSV
jgi:hypothetical protein